MIDIELDNILSKLIRKSQDISSFIGEEVKKALYQVCQESNEIKILSNIALNLNHKSISLRNHLNICLESLI